VTSEKQVQLKDQTPEKNPVTLERFVRNVASRVRQFLAVSFIPMVTVNSEIQLYLGLRTCSCPQPALELEVEGGT